MTNGMVFFTSAMFITLLLACVCVGYLLLTAISIPQASLGTFFIIGYAVLALLLLLSSKWFGTFLVGEMSFAFLLLGLSYFRMNRGVYSNLWSDWKKSLFQSVNQWTLCLGIILIPWAVVVMRVYAAFFFLPKRVYYYFPPIFDLPKHIFTILSLYQMTHWPPPNPFFSGEQFAYNFLFYAPIAAFAKLVGSPLAMYIPFAILILCIAVSMPLVIWDVVKRISHSKVVHLFAILLTTWVGGLTPLWVTTKPALGPLLIQNHLISSMAWIEEMYTYAIFIPQHIFAVLCGLIMANVLSGHAFQMSAKKKIILAGVLSLSGMLASLPLMPVISLSYALLIGWYLVVWQQDREVNFYSQDRLMLGLLAAIPLMIMLPFVLEVMSWTKQSGGFFVKPIFSSQWFYIAASAGLVVPFGVGGMLAVFPALLRTQHPTRYPLEIALLILIWVGVFFMLFGLYLDAGLKYGLWVRLTLIPLAAYGLSRLLRGVENHAWMKRGIITLLSICMLWLCLLNFPTTYFFLRFSKFKTTDAFQNLIQSIRHLPNHFQLALLTPDQMFAATIGRAIDFDFRGYREDAYMTVEGRGRADQFWNTIGKSSKATCQALTSRYDYVIVACSSTLSEQLKDCTRKIQEGANFAIYKIEKYISQ